MPALSLASFGVVGLWSGCSAVLLADLSRALGLSPGPLGVALFVGAATSLAAMAVGRLGTALVLGPLGNRGTLACAGLLAVFGMSLALATTLPALVVGGFLLVGLAISGIVPLAYSTAGHLFPGRTGAAVSVVTTFSFGGGLLSTPLVGGFAELAGLRVALGLGALAGLAVFLLSLRLPETNGQKD